jgi:hypothetical protein
MTMTFREWDFDSHEPLIHTPGGLGTSMNQENPHIHLENADTVIFQKTHLLSDQISPEPTGIPKQLLARPPGSQETKLQVSRIISNSKKSMQKFILERKIKVFSTKNCNQEQEIRSRKPEKSKIKNFFSPISHKDQLLSTTISLINIPSIILELPDNNKEPFKSIQKALTTQISRQNWENFFRTLAGFSFQNFNIMEWIKGNEKGKFEIDEFRENRRNRGKDFFLWDLKKGRSSRNFIKETEEIIIRNDEKNILRYGWYIALQEALKYPPAMSEDYYREICRVLRSIENEIKDKKSRGVDK